MLNRTRPPPGSELEGSAYVSTPTVEAAADDVVAGGAEDLLEPQPVAIAKVTTRSEAGVPNLTPTVPIRTPIPLASITSPNQRYNTPTPNRQATLPGLGQCSGMAPEGLLCRSATRLTVECHMMIPLSPKIGYAVTKIYLI